ncbi:Twin-arginine translocation pathway signal [Hyphomicrobium sp. LHD-15]|uniref:Twin-arginine translocation pathway signal n=1 Tax=Hyphomicrobium sp. LHD-15 TaxID=3072142 RepID=UPI00280DD811|nr:Twin-arginine translocation pathway signal [Hyphomicrobium sp. LHD-15]MDQ8698405.1 Twin-arginine translocation pathway signal [Hyphomicrobium sp. LHD-15]
MYNPPMQVGASAAARTEVTRRRLLQSMMLVTAALALPALPPGALAAPLNADQKTTLLRVARDIYPHDDLLDDAPYQAVLDAILVEAESSPEVADLLSKGLADLEQRAQHIYKANYIAISKPEEREGVLRTIELTDFFQKIKGGLLMGLYNNKTLWPKFGYDGSSWETGGFIDKGFDKIDWF